MREVKLPGVEWNGNYFPCIGWEDDYYIIVIFDRVVAVDKDFYERYRVVRKKNERLEYNDAHSL